MHYQHDEHVHRPKLDKRRVVVLSVFGIFLIGFGLYLLLKPQHAAAPASAAPKTESTSDSEAIASRILFVGDVFWGRTIETSSFASSQGLKYPTSSLTRADRNNYDAWIANFECPITNRDEPLNVQIDSLKFNCRPEFLPNLARWFTAASQANNHTMNQDGQWGVEQTRKYLEQNGIQYFGNYDMSKLDDICEVITVPATTTKTDEKVSLPVALCGYMQVVDVMPTQKQLAVMRQYAAVMPVIAFPHMGVEYRTTAETEKVRAYRAMIDNGADIVIGAHPHVIQNSEVYKKRLIAYSLGNFLFDQHSVSKDTNIGLGIGLKLTIKDGAAAKVFKSIAPDCKTYKDNCLARLSKVLDKRPEISVTYKFACYDESRSVGSVPKLCSPDTAAWAKQRATVENLAGLSATW